jgi:hypothetical protein
MPDVIFEVSEHLCESIAKSKAVAGLLQAVNQRNLAEETLPEVGWLLADELQRMQEQVNRLARGPASKKE